MNELLLETSPYLLQHATNPVHWKAWNPNSLAQAVEKNSLQIISIGYSACHWCHVMEHESFEDIEVAQTMNAHFVNIKIDREEYPNVDAIYMKAVQLMTGSGGWPLNIVALPDGRPVWGGTYFRKEEWITTLNQLQEMYKSHPEKMIVYAEKLHQGISDSSTILNKESNPEESELDLLALIEKWKKSFDLDFGGMARAPKFMMPNNYQFLLRYAHQYKETEILEFVNITLTKMAYGGLFDTVGGGFSRYSVDMKWHVPHFEKMLYDNGQLVSLYADAFKLTINPLYQEVIKKTLDFVSRELTHADGGFYSALDADSLNAANHLEEGAFYVWKIEELRKIIQSDFDLFAIVFNVNEFGYWEENNFVLIQNQALETIATAHEIEILELRAKKKYWENLLFWEREKRSKPRLDSKCLTSWNAIMLKGFVDGYKALANENYLNIAIKNAAFIIRNLWTPEGNLLHNYSNGKSKINGFLEDYCFLIEGFIALYEVTFDEKWLHNAKQLTDYCFDHFYDTKSQFFTFASNLDTPLIATHFEMEDNVIPASNSVMASNLYKLSIYFENAKYEKISQTMVENSISQIDYPAAFSNWLSVHLNISKDAKELAICSVEALEFNKKFHSHYLPNLLLAGTCSVSTLPFLKNRFQDKETLFYLCENKKCALPEPNFDVLIAKLT